MTNAAAYPPPDPLLLAAAPPAVWTPHDARREPRALDAACGAGQNGLWLAEQGYVVDLMDISRAALLQAQTEAAARGVRRINYMQVDFNEAALEANVYDLVCVFRYFNRDWLPKLRAAVRPGGRVIYQVEVMRGAASAAVEAEASARQGELASYFADWRLLLNDERGGHARLIALKP